jgi:hypothetical protein
VTVEDMRPVARLLGAYTKAHNAGGFAHPTAQELAEHPEWVHHEKVGSEQAVVIAKQLTRDSVRTDFTGAEFTVPKHALVATHIARTNWLVPDLGRYDYVNAYATDQMVSAALEAMGRVIVAHRVTSAAEVINVWGPRYAQRSYPAWDRATVVDMGFTSPDLIEQLSAEIATVTGWDDDFPYYSDGGWSAVCLKGFWPDQPGRGVKPSEMPRSWKNANPHDLDRKCLWTKLADELPRLTRFVQGVDWWPNTERVRLLKMAAGSSLGRHTDITDRDGGTRDGQITRFHLPLITDPSVLLHSWDFDGRRRSHHLQAGHVYYLDARKPHAVDNGSSINRVHLVVDVVTDGGVREAIADAFARQAR